MTLVARSELRFNDLTVVANDKLIALEASDGTQTRATCRVNMCRVGPTSTGEDFFARLQAGNLRMFVSPELIP